MSGDQLLQPGYCVYPDGVHRIARWKPATPSLDWDAHVQVAAALPELVEHGGSDAVRDATALFRAQHAAARAQAWAARVDAIRVDAGDTMRLPDIKPDPDHAETARRTTRFRLTAWIWRRR